MNKTRYIKAGGLIDGSGSPVRRNVFLGITGQIISAIGPAADLPRVDKTMVEELPHCTIVPPLVDCSVSLALSPSVDEKVQQAVEAADLAEKKSLVQQHLRYCSSHGVLGVAEVGDPEGAAGNPAELLPDESIVDIRTANIDFLRFIYSNIGGEVEVRAAGRKPEEMYKILPQKGVKKTVVVANGKQQVKEALAAGCDAIEQGYGMGEENLAEMAAKDVLWIPGVLMAQNGMQGSASGGDVMCRFSMRYVAPGKAEPGAEAFWRKMLAGQLAQLRLARKLGVRTAVGTGAGSVGILHGESMVEEIKLFIKAGWSLEEAIQCASVNGARFFGMENLGGVAVGRKATFVIARGAVSQLPRKLSYLENIYVAGEPGFLK